MLRTLFNARQIADERFRRLMSGFEKRFNDTL